MSDPLLSDLEALWHSMRHQCNYKKIFTDFIENGSLAFMIKTFHLFNQYDIYRKTLEEFLFLDDYLKEYTALLSAEILKHDTNQQFPCTDDYLLQLFSFHSNSNYRKNFFCSLFDLAKCLNSSDATKSSQKNCYTLQSFSCFESSTDTRSDFNARINFCNFLAVIFNLFNDKLSVDVQGEKYLLLQMNLFIRFASLLGMFSVKESTKALRSCLEALQTSNPLRTFYQWSSLFNFLTQIATVYANDSECLLLIGKLHYKLVLESDIYHSIIEQLNDNDNFVYYLELSKKVGLSNRFIESILNCDISYLSTSNIDLLLDLFRAFLKNLNLVSTELALNHFSLAQGKRIKSEATLVEKLFVFVIGEKINFCFNSLPLHNINILNSIACREASFENDFLQFKNEIQLNSCSNDRLYNMLIHCSHSVECYDYLITFFSPSNFSILLRQFIPTYFNLLFGKSTATVKICTALICQELKRNRSCLNEYFLIWDIEVLREDLKNEILSQRLPFFTMNVPSKLFYIEDIVDHSYDLSEIFSNYKNTSSSIEFKVRDDLTCVLFQYFTNSIIVEWICKKLTSEQLILILNQFPSLDYDTFPSSHYDKSNQNGNERLQSYDLNSESHLISWSILFDRAIAASSIASVLSDSIIKFIDCTLKYCQNDQTNSCMDLLLAVTKLSFLLNLEPTISALKGIFTSDSVLSQTHLNSDHDTLLIPFFNSIILLFPTTGTIIDMLRFNIPKSLFCQLIEKCTFLQFSQILNLLQTLLVNFTLFYQKCPVESVLFLSYVEGIVGMPGKGRFVRKLLHVTLPRILTVTSASSSIDNNIAVVTQRLVFSYCSSIMNYNEHIDASVQSSILLAIQQLPHNLVVIDQVAYIIFSIMPSAITKIPAVFFTCYCSLICTLVSKENEENMEYAMSALKMVTFELGKYRDVIRKFLPKVVGLLLNFVVEGRSEIKKIVCFHIKCLLECFTESENEYLLKSVLNDDQKVLFLSLIK